MSSDHGKFDVAPTESKTTRTVGNFPRGSRETPAASASREADRSEKAKSRKSDMHVVGESDSSIVPKKPANNDGVPPSAEPVEGRGLTKENAEPSLLDRTQCRTPRSRGLLGVREAAQRDKKMRFNNLLHHLTPDLLQASFFALKKQAAPGIDGVTWARYAEDFARRIDDLHGRIHRGAYRAQPSKRSWIPKMDGRSGRWGSRRWKTKSSSKPCGRCWNASTNRIFWVSVTAFGPAEAVTKPWMHSYVGIKTAESELDSGCGHSRLLRQHRPRLADEVPGASNRRPPNATAVEEMASGRSLGERPVVSDEGRNAPRRGDFAALGQRVFALRLGPVGGSMAEMSCMGRGHHRTLCGRFCDGFREEADAVAAWRLCGNASPSLAWSYTRRRRG